MNIPATGVFAPERIFVAVRAMAPVAGSRKQRGENVGDTLAYQLHVWVVLISTHAIRNDRGHDDSIAPSMAT